MAAGAVTNLLEDSLAADLAAAGRLDHAMIDRFCVLAKYVESCGADAILFTCSAFGTAIEAARAAVKIPVLKPNEAMMEEAIATGPRIALLATFEPSLPSMKAELEQLAAARNAKLEIATRAVPSALTALQAGDDAGHDTQIAAAAAELGDCDALLLCQFSMASAAERIPVAPRPQRIHQPLLGGRALEAVAARIKRYEGGSHDRRIGDIVAAFALSGIGRRRERAAVPEQDRAFRGARLWPAARPTSRAACSAKNSASASASNSSSTTAAAPTATSASNSPPKRRPTATPS